MRRSWTSVVVLSAFALSCGDSTPYAKELSGGYFIFSDYRDEYEVYCQLASTSDPEIGPKLVHVEWDERAIIAEQQGEDGGGRFYVIAPSEPEAKLECGSGNALHGPLSQKEVEERRKALGLPEKLAHEVRL